MGYTGDVLERDTAVMEALHALADGAALADDGKLAAVGALMAIDGVRTYGEGAERRRGISCSHING